MKTIGILGGISPESTMLYYDHIVKAYHAREGNYYYPEIVIYSLNFQHFTDLEDSGDIQAYVQDIVTGIRALQGAGANFVLMAANSPHAVFDVVREQTNVDLLSIVRVTLDHAQERGMNTLLLLGIKFTMQSSFYRQACAARGIRLLVPTEAEQDEVNRIIFEELTIGLVLPESKARLLDIVGRYEVDGVILGCTELPLILGPDDTTVPLLNTLALHAEAALDYAMHGSPGVRRVRQPKENAD
jgi:aspartate racemase